MNEEEFKEFAKNVEDGIGLPDELINSCPRFSDEKILVAAELLMANKDKHGETHEEQMNWLTLQLADICHLQGMLRAADDQKTTPYKDLTDALYHAISYAHAAWQNVVSYLKDTSSTQLYPLGVVVYLKGICKEKPFPELEAALERFMRQWIKWQSEQIKDLEVVPVPEVENFTGDPKELILAYFNMANELETFYGDRSKYDSDDKRKLHDKMVAIFNKVIIKDGVDLG